MSESSCVPACDRGLKLPNNAGHVWLLARFMLPTTRTNVAVRAYILPGILADSLVMRCTPAVSFFSLHDVKEAYTIPKYRLHSGSFPTALKSSCHRSGPPSGKQTIQLVQLRAQRLSSELSENTHFQEPHIYGKPSNLPGFCFVDNLRF